MGTPPDEPVADYLARLDQAATVLPRGQRDDLRNDVREYIATQRAVSAGNVLDRLGDPAELVDTARRERQRFTVSAYVADRLTGRADAWARPAPPARPSTAALILAATLVVIGVCVGLGLLFFGPDDVRYR